MSTACYTKDPDCIGAYEAKDFFERYTPMLKGKLNGDQDLEQVYVIFHSIPCEIIFENFKTSARNLFSDLDELKKELEIKINKKLYCLSIDVKSIDHEVTRNPMQFKFECSFLEMGDLK